MTQGMSVPKVLFILVGTLGLWVILQIGKFRLDHGVIREELMEAMGLALVQERDDPKEKAMAVLEANHSQFREHTLRIDISPDRTQLTFYGVYERRIHLGFMTWPYPYEISFMRSRPRPAGNLGESIQKQVERNTQPSIKLPDSPTDQNLPTE